MQSILSEVGRQKPEVVYIINEEDFKLSIVNCSLSIAKMGVLECVLELAMMYISL